MTETTPSESKPEAVNQELPTPKFTEPSAGSSTSSVDTDALTEAILKRLEPVLDKKLQSTKDKRIADIEKKLGMRELTELEEAGVQIPDAVKMEYRLRQLEQQYQAPQSQQQTTTSPGSGANLTAQDVSEVVKGFNLNANDADVIEALRGTYRNRDHFETTLARLAIGKINKPTGTAAETATMTSSPASTVKEDLDGMLNKLKELQREPTKNRAEIKELKQKLEARNWQ